MLKNRFKFVTICSYVLNCCIYLFTRFLLKLNLINRKTDKNLVHRSLGKKSTLNKLDFQKRRFLYTY